MKFFFSDSDKKWQVLKNNKGFFYYKGYFNNKPLEEILLNLDDILKQPDEKKIKIFLKNLDGHYAFVYKTKSYTLAAVDKVKSIPLFFSTKDNYLSNNANFLISNEKIVNHNIDALRAIAMSGFSIGNATLIQNLNIFQPGQYLLNTHSKTIINYYYTFKPWKISELGEKKLKKELLELLEETFIELVRNSYSRQIVVPLSAGYDSRVVASLLKHIGVKDVYCYSYGLRNSFEVKASRQIAKKLNYKWKFIDFKKCKQVNFFQSEIYKKYFSEVESYSAIPYFQDFNAVKFLVENKEISKDAIFVNGNSGDFISGGHIPGSIFKPNLDLDRKYHNSMDDFLKKHFSLWGVLRNKTNDENIKALLYSELFQRGIRISPENKLYIFELFEFLGRQSKFVISGQRTYEMFGYDWRLPLWGSRMLNFWEKIDFKHKKNQNLYVSSLIDKNWGNVWKDIPLNKINYNSKKIFMLRKGLKLATYPLGKDLWETIDSNIFKFFMDPIGNSKIIPYQKVLFDMRGQKNWASWWSEEYIKKHMSCDINNIK